jgi:hypothetical protein
MARWNEEQERWTGGQGHYGDDERRWRGEVHGSGRDWRDEERGEGWREHREHGWRGEGRGPGWRSGEARGEWPPRGEEGAREPDLGDERWRGREGAGRGRGEPPGGSRFGPRGGYGGAPGEFGVDPYAIPAGTRRPSEHASWRGYGPREQPRGGYYGEGAGREDEPGPIERFGDKMREGFRKLTGRGPKGYKRSDERVREDVSERIARSWVDASDVEVKVENGEVTLTGFVRSREEKRTLEDLADDVFGVEEVHNHIRLRREGSETFVAGEGSSARTTQQPQGAGPQQPRQGGPTQSGRH